MRCRLCYKELHILKQNKQGQSIWECLNHECRNYKVVISGKDCKHHRYVEYHTQYCGMKQCTDCGEYFDERLFKVPTTVQHRIQNEKNKVARMEHCYKVCK
jgi:hypothetical protein